MFTVTVYSKPRCVQCDMTRKQLERLQIGYTTVDVTDNATALEFITEDLGYSQAPVVVVDQDPENHWSGFRPDQLKALARANASFAANHSIGSNHSNQTDAAGVAS